MDEDERKSENHRKASICHNWGYCLLHAGSVEARGHLEDAARYYLLAGRSRWVAYNLKYLAIYFEAFDEHALAVWCIRAAESIHRVEGVSESSDDHIHLDGHLRRITNSAVAASMPRPPAYFANEKAIDYAGRLLDAYGHLSPNLHANARIR